MADEKDEDREKEFLKLRRQALAAERLRFDALRRVRISQDPLKLDLLALGVAHEFNNIVGAIDGHAEWAIDSDKQENLIESLKIIRTACARSFQVTRALQNLIQPKEEDKKIFDLKEGLHESFQLYKIALEKKGIELNIEINEEVLVYGSPTRIQELFHNLTKNSIEAMSLSHTQSPKISISCRYTGEDVLIYFQDNGPGIQKAHREVLFQPFFTTKGTLATTFRDDNESTEDHAFIQKNSQEQNSGLGLYLSKTICQEHGGNIRYLPNKNFGACFEINLPRVYDTQLPKTG